MAILTFQQSRRTQGGSEALREWRRAARVGQAGPSVSWSGLAPEWQDSQTPALCLPRWASVSQRRRQDKWQSVSCARCQGAEFWTRIQVTAQSLMFFITNTVDSLDLTEWREKSTCKQLSFGDFLPLSYFSLDQCHRINRTFCSDGGVLCLPHPIW